VFVPVPSLPSKQNRRNGGNAGSSPVGDAKREKMKERNVTIAFAYNPDTVEESTQRMLYNAVQEMREVMLNTEVQFQITDQEINH
jgi:hypothetical protein